MLNCFFENSISRKYKDNLNLNCLNLIPVHFYVYWFVESTINRMDFLIDKKEKIGNS